ncbi:hypothetical protein EBT31_01375 [bacterium]|nr:hypothetical protein [bacterium]NBX49603.1 hypothetical protein [bacterium]
MEKNITCKNLIDHISRLEGQLASIKKELREENPDCTKASATLKAASRSFGSLKQAFITCFLAKKFLSQKQANIANNSPEYLALLDLIHA